MFLFADFLPHENKEFTQKKQALDAAILTSCKCSNTHRLEMQQYLPSDRMLMCLGQTKAGLIHVYIGICGVIAVWNS